eukprot:jgi/Ulvmu1/10758/UM068_0048.1
MEDPPSYDAVLQASQAEMERAAVPKAAKDTQVTVTDPVMQRGATGSQYTSYKVTTRTTNPKYKACNAADAVVMRRFSEFHMLFVKLQEEFPGVIVPPCPEKNQLGGFRKSSAFIEQRRQALEVFINKVCSHRILKHSQLLQLFLEADETAWHVKMQELKSGPEQGSLLGKMSQLASDLVHSTKNLTKGQSDDQGEDAEYLQYKEYATHLDHHLKDACSRSADFVARQAAYGEALGAFATQAASMSKFEEGAAAQAFLELNTAASAVAEEHASAHTHMNRIFAAPMKEQHLAMKSLKETMQARSTALGHKAQAEAAVKVVRARLAQLRSSGKPEAVLQAETKLNDAEAAERAAGEQYDAMAARMREEVAAFQAERSDDMARALRDFALAQAKLARQSAVRWRGLVGKMKTAQGAPGAGPSVATVV